jgi:flagellar hook-associated protein 3 FlgL
MDQAIAALSMPESSQESARRGNALFALSANIDGGLDRMLEARTSLGSRLNEVEAALSSDSARSDALTEEMARVTGADAATQVELATELAQRKFSVEAAQLTYTKISQLSIFNYL